MIEEIEMIKFWMKNWISFTQKKPNTSGVNVVGGHEVLERVLLLEPSRQLDSRLLAVNIDALIRGIKGGEEEVKRWLRRSRSVERTTHYPYRQVLMFILQFFHQSSANLQKNILTINS